MGARSATDVAAAANRLVRRTNAAYASLRSPPSFSSPPSPPPAAKHPGRPPPDHRFRRSENIPRRYSSSAGTYDRRIAAPPGVFPHGAYDTTSVPTHSAAAASSCSWGTCKGETRSRGTSASASSTRYCAMLLKLLSPAVDHRNGDVTFTSTATAAWPGGIGYPHAGVDEPPGRSPSASSSAGRFLLPAFRFFFFFVRPLEDDPRKLDVDRAPPPRPPASTAPASFASMGSSLSSGKINTPSGDAPSRPDVDGARARRVAVAARLGVGERNVEGKETNLEKARVGTRAEEREERGRLLFASELASDRARAGRGGFNIVRHGDRPASLRLVGVVAGGPEVSRESRRVRVRLGEAPRARCGSVVRGLDGPNGDGGVEDLALRVAGLAPGAGEVERAHGGFRAPKTQREREGTRGDAPLARRLPRGCVLTHEGERRVVRVARVRGLEQHRRLGGEGAISRVSAERPDRDGSPTQVGHAVPAHATGVVSQTGSVLGHDAIEVDASGGRRGRGHSARGVVTDPGTAGAFS